MTKWTQTSSRATRVVNGIAKRVKKTIPKERRAPRLNVHKELRNLMSTAADLQAAVDALTAAVQKVSDEVKALKSAPPVVQNVEQAQLDANTQAITDATTALNGL